LPFILTVFFSLLPSFLSLFADPPAPPLISGYIEGQIIPAGSVQKLLCVSSGGNPLATLTWYKNDKRVSWKFSKFLHSQHLQHLHHTNVQQKSI